jgi:uncharacterized membrane protein
MKKKARKNKLLKYFIYFIIFSFMGSLIEYLFGFFGGTGIAFDKALYEMFNIKFYFIPFYGIVGLTLIFFENFFEKINKHKIKFIYQGLLNGIVIVSWELVGGLFSIFIYGHNFWDYSNQSLNFMGIISLQMSLLWVVMGYFFSFIYQILIKKIK